MPCLRPSAVCASLQPAAELGHLPRHGHALHVLRALLLPRVPRASRPQTCSRTLSHARCVHIAMLAASRLLARSPPRTVCPACDPRQFAEAFNQPLGWDTSGVTDMRYIFDVRCSPAPAPSACSLSPSTLHRLHPDCACIPAGCGSSVTPHIPRTPSVRLGRTQTRCPTPTSCSSAVRGRAPPPSPPLAMTRVGRREAATEALTEVLCVRSRQSLWRLPVPQPAAHVRGVHTYTDAHPLKRGEETKRAAAAAA